MSSGSNRVFFKFYYLTSLPSEISHLLELAWSLAATQTTWIRIPRNDYQKVDWFICSCPWTPSELGDEKLQVCTDCVRIRDRAEFLRAGRGSLIELSNYRQGKELYMNREWWGWKGRPLQEQRVTSRAMKTQNALTLCNNNLLAVANLHCIMQRAPCIQSPKLETDWYLQLILCLSSFLFQVITKPYSWTMYVSQSWLSSQQPGLSWPWLLHPCIDLGIRNLCAQLDSQQLLRWSFDQQILLSFILYHALLWSEYP